MIKRCPAKRGLAGAVALGVVFGGMSYMAQENLIGGVVGAIVVGLLLMVSGSAPARAVITSLIAVAVGFVIIWVPVLAYYTDKGFLGRFLYLYLLTPRAVAEGYSNTVFGGLLHTPSPWVTMYFVLPYILFVLALLWVTQVRPFRIAFEWTHDRIMVVAVLITTILLYQGALLRSDNAHLTGTLLILPAMIIVVAAALPRLFGARRRWTLIRQVLPCSQRRSRCCPSLPMSGQRRLGPDLAVSRPAADHGRCSALRPGQSGCPPGRGRAGQRVIVLSVLHLADAAVPAVDEPHPQDRR